VPDARTVLEDPHLDGLLSSLGLRPQDAAELGAVVARVRHDPAGLAEVDRLAAGLRSRLGVFPGEPGAEDWTGYDPATDPEGVGVLPLLALVVTASDLAAFHRARGVPAEVSAATLRELGQQVWVHRLTFGALGLHTYGWLLVTWSGSLYWLGRLQFNLELQDDGWVCSTHIPRSGPLDPAAVDASFAAAAAFFPAWFPDRPVRGFWCSSWLLDPTLVQALDPASNMARFQARWRLYGEPMPGDEDALFFTFARRGEVDLATLPRDTTLQRVVADRLREGGHWAVRTGRLPLTTIGERA
jgi:GNAT domain-containint protein/N-acyltransferase family protein